MAAEETAVEKWLGWLLYWGTATLVVFFMVSGIYFLWVRPLLR